LKRWVVKHAGAGGESAIYNTRDFKLQVSNDGINFTDVDTVTGNSTNITDRNINTNARYVRLYITQGTQIGYDGYARIDDFEVYGTASGNTALNKTATANAYNLPSEAPQYAVDGSTGTKWASIAPSPNWLKFDPQTGFDGYARIYELEVYN
jgi:hypothetical protein